MISTRKERVGWYFYDWANSAFVTIVVTVFMGPYLSSIAEKAADASGNVSVFGIPIYSESFFPYIVFVSVLFQLVLLPLIGALADYTNRKKQLLGIFSYIGALATMLMYFLQGEMYLFGGTLFIIANVCFGASMVMYNAYLNEIAEPKDRDTVSSIGWGIGYLGGGLLLAINLYLFSMADTLFEERATEFAIRICLASAGVWWGIFTIIPMLTLKVRKQIKAVPQGQNIFKISFKELINTIKDARNHPQTLLFLLAFFFYNDGVQAVITLSAQFGNRELGISHDSLIIAILMVQFVAFLGAMFFNWLAKPLGTKRAILFSLVIWTGTVFYAYQYLNSETGFFILAGVIAIVLGGTQALSRSLYSQYIPKGKEAEYFSLYEVGEKGSSLLAPLMFGLAIQFTHSYRIAILSLSFFFIIGFVLLMKLKNPPKEAN